MAARHWLRGYGRIWREATEAVGLGSVARVIGFCVVQACISVGLYFWLGQTALASAMPVRLLTAGAPFGAIPLLLLWRLIVAPASFAEAMEAASHDAKPFPDMRIGELFYHVQPDMFAETEGDQLDPRWHIVAANILDELSLGRLQVWGRRIGPGRRGTSRRRGPLAEIEDKKVWQTARFTYWFLSPTTDAASTHFESEEGEWADVRFNTKQVKAIWPDRPSKALAAQ
jgi:hypothetical protein